MVYAQWNGIAGAQAASTVQLCAHVIANTSSCDGTTDKQLVYYEEQPLIYSTPLLIQNAFNYWKKPCSLLDAAKVANYAPNYVTDDCARLCIGRGQYFGCAASVKKLASDDKNVGLLFACTFIDCFAANCPLYTQATTAASGCSFISQSKYKCLCAVGQNYDYTACPKP